MLEKHLLQRLDASGDQHCLMFEVGGRCSMGSIFTQAKSSERQQFATQSAVNVLFVRRNSTLSTQGSRSRSQACTKRKSANLEASVARPVTVSHWFCPFVQLRQIALELFGVGIQLWRSLEVFGRHRSGHDGREAQSSAGPVLNRTPLVDSPGMWPHRPLN